MIPLNASGSIHACLANGRDQYLEPTPDLTLTLDSFQSQSEMSSFITSSDTSCFDAFMDWELTQATIPADHAAVFPNTEPTMMDLSRAISMSPLFTPLPISVPGITDAGLFPAPTTFGNIAVPPMGAVFRDVTHGTRPYPAVPDLDLYVGSYKYGEPITGGNSERAVRTHSMVAHSLAVPQMPFFQCLTCKKQFASEFRLTEHQKSHAIALFGCSSCKRKFALHKDLKRHNLTHEPFRPRFACSCQRAYARPDGLLRHIAKEASRGAKGDHSPATTSGNPTLSSVPRMKPPASGRRLSQM